MSNSVDDGSPEDPFEFPVSRSAKESFIKLPSGWKELVQGEKIEFIGISMDPQYANLMLPGQFKTLGFLFNFFYKKKQRLQLNFKS